MVYLKSIMKNAEGEKKKLVFLILIVHVSSDVIEKFC